MKEGVSLSRVILGSFLKSMPTLSKMIMLYHHTLEAMISNLVYSPAIMTPKWLTVAITTQA